MATGTATAAGAAAGFSALTTAPGLRADFAGLATDLDSGLADDFGMDLITDLVSGLAALPEIPGLAGTGLATACLLAVEARDLAEDFLTSGFTADAAFFRAGLADADLEDATGFTAGFGAAFAGDFTVFAELAAGLPGLTATFGAVLALTALFTPFFAEGFAVVLDAVFTAARAGVAGFFLTAAFMICLLSKSAPHESGGLFLAERP